MKIYKKSRTIKVGKNIVIFLPFHIRRHIGVGGIVVDYRVL